MERYLQSNDYQYKPQINLLDSESNTVFVGSGTNAFWDEIIQMKLEGRYYSIQPCLRCHNLKEYDKYDKKNTNFFYKSYFEMIGTMERGSLDEEKVRMYCKMVFQSFDIKKSNVLVVLPRKFEKLKDYLKKDFGINKIKIEERKKFTQWNYGVPYLEGVGISFYTVCSGKVVQIFDMVEIKDKRNSNLYVETGLVIDNFRVFDKKYDCINKIFQQSTSELNLKEKIYFDSLLAVVEIYRALEKKKYIENVRQRCIREKFFKYVLVYGNEIGKSEEYIMKEIKKHLNYYGNENGHLEKIIDDDMKRIGNNIENILKEYKKYLKNTPTIDVEYVKKTLGVLEIWI